MSYRYVENVFRRFKKPELQPGEPKMAHFFQSKSAKIMAGIAAVFMLGTVNAVSAKEAGSARPKT